MYQYVQDIMYSKNIVNLHLLHCKNSTVVLNLLWLSQVQSRYYCAVEVVIHAAEV